MTSLIGSPTERWPLSRAVDAMIAAAARAGIPGLVWVVGWVYPSLGIELGLFRELLHVLEQTTDVQVAGADHWLFDGPDVITPINLFHAQQPSIWMLLFVPLFLPVARLIVGLAAVSDGESWSRAGGGRRPPRLLAVWQAGRGLGMSAVGLYLTGPLLFFAAVMFLLGPAVFLLNLVDVLRAVPTLLLVGMLPLALVLIAYGVLVQVLIQLALHSLARNQRGCASALQHAWRLVKNSPWGTVRALVVDLLLQGTVLSVGYVLQRLLGEVGVVPVVLLWSFFGVTRAGYWARTFAGLGGMATAPAHSRVLATRGA